MRLLQLLFGLIFIAVVLQSNKGGRNEATTGAPFESNKNACANCHSGGNFTPEIKFNLKDSDGNILSAYEPNQTYTLEILLSSTTGSPKAFGFQAVIVDEALKNAGKILQNGDKVRNITIQNKSYLTQTTPKEDGIFTALWQAPENVNDLKIYIAGIATNGNSNTNGDKAVKSEFDILKSQTSSVFQYESDKPKLVCNNGCNELSFDKEVLKLIVFNKNGQVLIKESKSIRSLPIDQLASDIYFIVYEFGSKMYSEKFIK